MLGVASTRPPMCRRMRLQLHRRAHQCVDAWHRRLHRPMQPTAAPTAVPTAAPTAAKVSRSDHPTSPAMRRSWHHRRLAALAHDQLPKKHIATSTAVQRRSVNQGNAVNTTCKLLRGPPSTERATQTTQSRPQHTSWRSERRTVVGSPSNFASKLVHVVGVAFR